MTEYIPFAVINAGAFTPDNDIILVCIVKARGRSKAWGGTWLEQHRSIRGGETRESRCQVQFGRLVLGTKPVLSFESIHDGVIDASRGCNSANIATVLLATDVDYTDGMAEAKVMREQCELVARLIRRGICPGCRIHEGPLRLGHLWLCAPVDWRRRAGVGLRNGEICEQC